MQSSMLLGRLLFFQRAPSLLEQLVPPRASAELPMPQVVLTASFFKAAISIGDTLAGYTNTSKPLGTVSEPSKGSRGLKLLVVLQ